MRRIASAAVAAVSIIVACSPPDSTGAVEEPPVVEPVIALQQMELARSSLDASLAEAKLPPRLTDPVIGPKLRAALDVQAIPAVSIGDMPAVQSLCQQAVALQNFFLNWAPEGGQPNVERNFLEYQDEVSLSLRFSVACGAHSLAALEKFTAALGPGELTPARREGLAAVRRGMMNIYVGVVRMQLDDLKPANRQLVLEQATLHAGAYSAAMPIADRKAVIQAVDQVTASSSVPTATHQNLLKIRREMARPDCTGLCAI